MDSTEFRNYDRYALLYQFFIHQLHIGYDVFLQSAIPYIDAAAFRLICKIIWGIQMYCHCNMLILWNLQFHHRIICDRIAIWTYDQCSRLILTANSSHSVYKCLIQSVHCRPSICITTGPFLRRALDSRLIHSLKEQMFIIICKSLSNLLPDGTQFILYLIQPIRLRFQPIIRLMVRI